MRVLVTGDREWDDAWKIKERLEKLDSDTVIIHGDCRGVDRIAGEVAEQIGFEVIAYPADWKRYGKAAGPIRNKEMLDKGHPDLVIAFHPNMNQSKGTKNMFTVAKRRGIAVEHIK